MKRRQPIAGEIKPVRKPAPARRRDSVGAADARIYDSIFQAVMMQRLKPGMKLPEPQLCELFGVSRTLVRKALQRLAGDHIVELRPNRGAVVASPTPEETREIFVARRAIEAAIMPLAIANNTPARIELLRTDERVRRTRIQTQPTFATTLAHRLIGVELRARHE